MATYGLLDEITTFNPTQTYTNELIAQLKEDVEKAKAASMAVYDFKYYNVPTVINSTGYSVTFDANNINSTTYEILFGKKTKYIPGENCIF